MGFDVDEFLNDYESQRVSATVCPKAGLVVEHARLDLALHEAHRAAGDTMHDPDVSRLRREIADVEQQIADSQVTFWFKGVGYLAWQTLKRKHPPTKDQRDDGLDINIETFVVPALAVCACEPELTTEQANRLASTLPDGEIQKLFRAALNANGETLAPKSLLAAAIGGLAQSDRSSITAALAVSLAASGSDANGAASPSTSTTTPGD